MILTGSLFQRFTCYERESKILTVKFYSSRGVFIGRAKITPIQARAFEIAQSTFGTTRSDQRRVVIRHEALRIFDWHLAPRGLFSVIHAMGIDVEPAGEAARASVPPARPPSFPLPDAELHGRPAGEPAVNVYSRTLSPRTVTNN
jgi:hypothetical protein